MSDYLDSVKKHASGMRSISVGACPGCKVCAKLYGYSDIGEFNEAIRSGDESCESHFSWKPCDLCGSTFGGDREHWHAIDDESGELICGDSACIDCAVYFVAGAEPINWMQHPK